MTKMTKPERVAYAISESGETPASMARMIGCTSAAIYQWIAGDTKDIRNELLFALADATKFHARWIATGEGPERPREDERLARLAELFGTLDERGKTAVFRVAETESAYSLSPDIKDEKSA